MAYHKRLSTSFNLFSVWCRDLAQQEPRILVRFSDDRDTPHGLRPVHGASQIDCQFAIHVGKFWWKKFELICKMVGGYRAIIFVWCVMVIYLSRCVRCWSSGWSKAVSNWSLKRGQSFNPWSFTIALCTSRKNHSCLPTEWMKLTDSWQMLWPACLFPPRIVRLILKWPTQLNSWKFFHRKHKKASIAEK